ncbi:MAG TPA: metal-dependent hydrolase, partial [Roseiflexaceae bacterium]|nr:metal-dependent hydrolase [Roseiflexaceae bacterium]
IPGHYGTFPLLTGTPEELRRQCQELGVNVEVIALRPGESAS